MTSHNTPTPLEQGSFPRTCESCKKVYPNELAFFQETTAIPAPGDSARARIQVSGDNGGFLDIFRKCQCGATLMERFYSRRDLSEEGLRNRASFEDLLKAVEESGVERAEARGMLLDFLAGKQD